MFSIQLGGNISKVFFSYCVIFGLNQCLDMILLGENSSFKIYKTPSARLVVEYLGCRSQRVGFQVSGFNSSGSI